MNPILAMLQNSNSKNILSQIQSIKSMLAGKNPDEFYNQLMQDNPQFKKFVEDNKGKSPEQIARENGIDFNLLK